MIIKLINNKNVSKKSILRMADSDFDFDSLTPEQKVQFEKLLNKRLKEEVGKTAVKPVCGALVPTNPKKLKDKKREGTLYAEDYTDGHKHKNTRYYMKCTRHSAEGEAFCKSHSDATKRKEFAVKMAEGVLRVIESPDEIKPKKSASSDAGASEGEIFIVRNPALTAMMQRIHEAVIRDSVPSTKDATAAAASAAEAAATSASDDEENGPPHTNEDESENDDDQVIIATSDGKEYTLTPSSMEVYEPGEDSDELTMIGQLIEVSIKNAPIKYDDKKWCIVDDIEYEGTTYKKCLITKGVFSIDDTTGIYQKVGTWTTKKDGTTTVKLT